jgi:hypothetical protein
METAGNSLCHEQAPCSAPSLQALLQHISALLFSELDSRAPEPIVRIDKDVCRLTVIWKPVNRNLRPRCTEGGRTSQEKARKRAARRGPAAQERSRKRAAEHRARLSRRAVDQATCNHYSRSQSPVQSVMRDPCDSQDNLTWKRAAEYRARLQGQNVGQAACDHDSLSQSPMLTVPSDPPMSCVSQDILNVRQGRIEAIQEMAHQEIMMVDYAIRLANHTGKFRGMYSDEYDSHEEFMKDVRQCVTQEVME